MKSKRIMDKLIFFVAFLVHQATAENVIYKLDDADYYRMPMKNNFERFEPCIGVTGGVYCTVHADLVSDEPNELLDMIKGYSAHHEKHFNYSNIMYGICITKSCKPYYNGDNSQEALWNTSEACLNSSLSREYGLKSRVFEMYCQQKEKQSTPDSLDIMVAAIVFGILGLNLLGTLYDFFIRNEKKPGNSILMAFAIRPNLTRMVAPGSSDPRQVQLRHIHGIRVITSILVILGHVPVGSIMSIENPTWFENAYRIIPFHILLQGHLITLTFFVISGFLLTYNVQLQSEKHKLTWRVLPKAVLIRFLRLTPSSLMILLFTVTWLRFTGSGPLWHLAIEREYTDCRKYWFYNAFYINNLIDHSQCNLQMWSLASDMQLHVIGLAIALIAPSKRVRNWTMVGLYILGILWPAYHIYTKDLDGSLLGTANTIATFFLSSDAFNYVYKRTYSNLPCFVMGMALGYHVYDLQKKNRIQGDYSKWRFVYWALFPCMLATILTAYFLFFLDAPRASMMTRLLFAPIVKPLFGTLVIGIILGAIYGVEGLYSGVMGWGIWVPLARISYCMYVVHVSIVRYLGGTKHTLSYLSLFHMFQEYAGTVFLTILCAMLLYLLVEAPFAGLVRLATMPAAKPVASVKSANSAATLATNGVNGHAKNGHTNGLKKD